MVSDMETVICSDGIKRKWNPSVKPITCTMNGCLFEFGHVTCQVYGAVYGYKNCTDNTFVEKNEPLFSMQDVEYTQNPTLIDFIENEVTINGVQLLDLLVAVHLRGILDGQSHPDIHPELLHHNSTYYRDLVSSVVNSETEEQHKRINCGLCSVELSGSRVVPKFYKDGVRVCTKCLFKEQQLELNYEKD